MLFLEPGIPAADHLERVAQCAGQCCCWPIKLLSAHADRVLDRDDSLTDILHAWKNSKGGGLWG